MAQETITQIQSAPDYLKPGIEKFLEGATRQAGQALDTSKFAPTVAAQDALQTQAATLAASGVGSYQPFLTAAQQALTTAGGLTGSQAYKDFMSP